MGHICKYAILMVVPDSRRGERVNVGLVVFLPDRVDVRCSASKKIGAIATGNWDAYVENAYRQLVASPDYSSIGSDKMTNPKPVRTHMILMLTRDRYGSTE